jgi:DNA-binding NtrC family response regulator
MAKILVVDDEPSVRQAFEEILSSKGHAVVSVRGAEDAIGSLQNDDCDLVILDICLPGMNGLDALGRIKQRRPKLPVIVMTGRGTTGTAIEATKRGAFDYQLKPFEPAEKLRAIAKALEGARLMKGDVALGPETSVSSTEAIVGRSVAMQQIYKAIGRVAPTDATVLIRGESGTGKELVARAIYQYSLRSSRPLMVVNCAAIPETLLESELLGYEPGAFTGATTRRIGKFEQVHGGTIFLDEIGDMPVMVQAKILRLLQERTFQRLGGNETIQVDVRVLCATNRNLEKAIAEGSTRPRRRRGPPGLLLGDPGPCDSRHFHATSEWFGCTGADQAPGPRDSGHSLYRA